MAREKDISQVLQAIFPLNGSITATEKQYQNTHAEPVHMRIRYANEWTWRILPIGYASNGTLCRPFSSHETAVHYSPGYQLCQSPAMLSPTANWQKIISFMNLSRQQTR
ncbi:hypothetical protein BDEG_25060 [Batrachochytrium dendrobatidis JEL423]|uniref:Uncharacterized protein n=1 Tax=Batrachochytrium dendrobatidis (strain JEL423) TaxID=403673 RepID=A0A177WPW7_BATDL|nr:hypothetical protein BDEG_25060 [Batrachochytrium dendrobatidis JEL423]